MSHDPNAATTRGPDPNWKPGMTMGGARMPIPGNAELLNWIMMLVVVAIVALASDRVDAPLWVEFAKWTTAAYLISRGIAKASRVLEQ